MIPTFLVIAGAIIATIVGTVWYSPATPMGRLHMRALGFDALSSEEQAASMQKGKAMMPRLYTLQLALSLLTSGAVVLIVFMSRTNGVTLPMTLGFIGFNWLCFIVPTIGSAILWGNVDRATAFKKFISDSASVLVTILLTALLANLFV